MQGCPREKQRQAGFALVVVLFSLIVLTTLFAVSQQRVLAHNQSAMAERDLLVREQHRRSILAVALAMKTADPSLTGFEITIGADPVSARFVDVAGLIDINTASPVLIELLVSELDLAPETLENYRRWRRDGQRFSATPDFLRVLGADPARRAELSRLATAFSGRPGVALAHAPERLAARLRGTNINPSLLDAAPSNERYLVLSESGGSFRLQPLGTIDIGVNGGAGAILQVNR